MLTFDDGPHHLLTPQILDILKEKKVRATFFVTGSKAINHPEILKRMVAEGHEIATRGWVPEKFTKLSQSQILSTIKKTNDIVRATTERISVFVRPPFGITNADINRSIKNATNATTILWSLDSQDDAHFITKAGLEKKIAKKAKPGDIILFHDTQQVAVEALPNVLDYLNSQGYECLTISEVSSFPDDSPH